ncbi:MULTISPECIES: 3'-5' exonuclease [unclassified Endozoicomonas]|uniref:3'-5' exonuclease n=1 Tax=unclassified Endozoicomonas TaxID=2644528 RepID=UPI003BB6B863
MHRVRLGDYRLPFFINQKDKNIVLLAFFKRTENSYRVLDSVSTVPVGELPKEQKDAVQQPLPEGLSVPQKPRKKVYTVKKSKVLPQTQVSEKTPEVDDFFEIEKFELDLIHIPDEYHQIILENSRHSLFASDKLPEDINARLQDYITAPQLNHIGKLYSLGATQTLKDIALQPLENFLLKLDRRQQEIIDKPLNSGSFKVTGGPGTGKTLIALYRMKKLVEERATEFLWSTGQNIGFITYTHSLVKTNKLLFDAIHPGNMEGINLSFTTFDRNIYVLFQSLCAIRKVREPVIPNGLVHFFKNKISVCFSQDPSLDVAVVTSLDETKGLDFVYDEIEGVIEANNLKTEAEYLAFKRVGRKTPLLRSARAKIWQVYAVYEELLKQYNYTSFSRKRLEVLRAFEEGLNIMPERFNALFIDEAQDLSVVSLRILMHMLDDPGFVMLCLDGGQSIYSKSPVGTNVHKNFRFNRANSHTLKNSYRMTRQILTALAPLRNETMSRPEDRTGLSDAVVEGDKPSLIKRPLEEHPEVVVEIVMDQVTSGVNANQIGIITKDWDSAAKYCRLLNAEGLQAEVFNKQQGLVLRDGCVNIITAHSAKGLEFPFVIVPDISSHSYPDIRKIDNAKDKGDEEEVRLMEQRLLYVALSRACRKLWVIEDTDNPCEFLASTHSQHWQVGD